MTFRLPRPPRNVQFVDPKTGLLTKIAQQWLQSFAESAETEIGALQAAQDAQDAADAAAASAAAATTAATTAQTAADDAQDSADGANSVASLTASGVTGTNILTATDAGTDATIIVDNHTRVYGDGTTLAITGASLTGRAYSTTFFVYYDDPTRADTTPAFQTTTSEATAAQTGDRHLVGMVVTPAAAAPDTDGDYVRVPGVGGIIP